MHRFERTIARGGNDSLLSSVIARRRRRRRFLDIIELIESRVRAREMYRAVQRDRWLRCFRATRRRDRDKLTSTDPASDTPDEEARTFVPTRGKYYSKPTGPAPPIADIY